MRRICEGFRNAGEYGLWVSKPGKDVMTASADELLFNMSNLPVRPYISGIIDRATIGSGGFLTSTTLSHGLGYVPVVLFGSNKPWRFGGVSITVLEVSTTDLKFYGQAQLSQTSGAAFLNSTYLWYASMKQQAAT